MFNHILVPLDGSELAECVLPHLAALARPQGLENFCPRITLIRVLEVEGEENHDQPVNPIQWRMNKVEAEAYLERVADRAKAAGIGQVETFLPEGNPAQHIIEYAQHNQVDLILLSSHGRSGLTRWSISSVVRKILQSARVSIMLIRAFNFQPNQTMDLRYHAILVPLDGSLRAEVALPVAVNLAQIHQAELVLTHVIQQPEPIQRIPLAPEDQALIKQVIDRNFENSRQYLEQLRSNIPDTIQSDLELHVNNNVNIMLQRMIDEHHTDLVVLSAHGHSADAMRSYGNVTSGMIEYGSTAMLAVQDLTPEQVEPTQAEEAAREHKGHA